MTNANQKELNCQEVVELVTDYLEQALLPETQAQFEEHIGNARAAISTWNKYSKQL